MNSARPRSSPQPCRTAVAENILPSAASIAYREVKVRRRWQAEEMLEIANFRAP